MAKTNITQYSATPSSNTDINSINIDENCPASGLNNAIRELMAHLKNVDTGSQALTALSVTGDLTVTGDIVSNTAGTSNFRAGVNAGDAIASGGNYNTVVGDEAGTAITTGDNNTALGYQAGASITTTSNCTVVGHDAGGDITTGTQNTIVGSNAGNAITEGQYNVVMGVDALGADTKGSKNVAIGNDALNVQNFPNATDSFNVAVGYGAGKDITDGQRNILVGGIAGEEITDADDCVGIGYRSCGGNAGSATTGHDNICIGTDAGEALTSGNKNCFMGKGAGNVYTTGYQNICIGHGSDGSAVDRYLEYVIGVNCTSAGYDGLITIGVNNGSDRIYNNFKSNATWTRISDERYKKDITDNTDCGLDFINDLRPRTFKWKPLADIDNTLPDYDPTKTTHSYPNKHYGLIAQEVKATLEAHNITDFGGHDVVEDSGIQAISEQMFVHPLIKAVQELSAKVTALETANTALEARITALENA